MAIKFRFEDKAYEVGDEAYDKCKIVLPDGRLLEPTKWLESFPPQAEGLHIVPHLFEKLTPEDIARNLNASIAKVLE